MFVVYLLKLILRELGLPATKLCPWRLEARESNRFRAVSERLELTL